MSRLFIVKILVTKYEFYEIEASSLDDAQENYNNGSMFFCMFDECQIASIVPVV